MRIPKILVVPGSLRAGSHNVRLAALMTKELTLLDAEVTRISFADYDLPIYDANLENKGGPPANALALKQMISAHHGVFIASPEYNASIPALVKNSLDWVSRVRERNEPPLAAFRNRVFALGSASPGAFGGMRGLIALRQMLEIGCGALVIPEQISVPHADNAFNDRDELADIRAAGQLRSVAQRLVDMVRLAAMETA